MVLKALGGAFALRTGIGLVLTSLGGAFALRAGIGLVLTSLGGAFALREGIGHSFNRRASRWGLQSSIDDSYLDLNRDQAPLKQLQIRFDCSSVNSEELSELLFECGVLSVSVEGESERAEVLNDEKNWHDLQRTRSWATALLRANFPVSFDVEGLEEILSAAYPKTKFSLKTVVDVENKDWVSEVQQNWRPQVISDLTIRFPWHAPGETTTSLELVLEGGAAFGTGDHPTTRLCTRWLAKNIIAAGTDATVLDYGCGSAILGLAALRYGATSAAGVDIDKDALKSASNNCKLNDLKMELFLAKEEGEVEGESKAVSMNTLRGFSDSFSSVDKLDGREFDLVVANILAPILIMLAPLLARFTKPGGKIALSGIVDRQAETVIAAFSEFFDGVKVVEEEESWVCIEGRKKNSEWQDFLHARQERFF